jgi:hypothetical protein
MAGKKNQSAGKEALGKGWLFGVPLFEEWVIHWEAGKDTSKQALAAQPVDSVTAYVNKQYWYGLPKPHSSPCQSLNTDPVGRKHFHTEYAMD